MTAARYPVPDGIGPRPDGWHAWRVRAIDVGGSAATRPAPAERATHGPPDPTWSAAARTWLLRRPGDPTLRYPNRTHTTDGSP